MTMNLARLLLLPFSFLYAVGVALRNCLFDVGLIRSVKVSVPVISVGNISAGGVGKTPFVEFLVKRLLQQGRKVAVVSRGYKRSGGGTVVVGNGQVMCAEADVSGDEPAQVAAKFRNAIVIVDEDRPRGAQYAIDHFGAEVILLDDGFQHRYLSRDRDVVILPAEEILGRTFLSPAGNRREPYLSLRRADLLVVSRCRDERQFERARIRLLKYGKPIIGMQTSVNALKRIKTNAQLDPEAVKGKKFLAFSGIGNPASFEATLDSLRLKIEEHLIYPDHHRFTDSDLASIAQTFNRLGADYLVTTEKDVTRLLGMKDAAHSLFEGLPVYYVEIEQVVLAGEQQLDEMLVKL